ncbi:MAG: hypothetical protein NTZ20_01980 [Candidatus Levybacteria bacterium]|nr:hypothetical protein [Candidatus Levybacteria bacterium]
MKFIYVFLLTILLSIFRIMPAYAIENPLDVPNNKIGIHILFPSEIINAAKLVNANGDWGYVVIPIQAGDKDLLKWQKFMDDAKELHIIPIIRIATEIDYFNSLAWRKPKYWDILDFANFLDSLTWPITNRYIIIFNEVNRSDEWGGSTNPSEYADILNYSIKIFKSINKDFFIISSGMDNGAATVRGVSINQYDYFREMNNAIPGIFNNIDGLASHSYPNPAFAQPPSIKGATTITSFLYEKRLIESLTNGKDIPVFITETGWSNKVVSDDLISIYFATALDNVWNNSRIVAIIPFILEAGAPFDEFSFINSDGSKSKVYKIVEKIEKIKGEPKLEKIIVDKKIESKIIQDIKDFSYHENILKVSKLSEDVKKAIRWLLKI